MTCRVACTATFLALFLWLASASGQQRRAVPVVAPEIPFQLAGASVRSPSGKEWHILERSDFHLLLGKPPKTPTHTVYALVAVTRIPREVEVDPKNLIAQARDRVGKLESDSRFSDAHLQVSADALYPSNCVRYTLSAVDRGSAPAPGAPLRMLGLGRICVNPETGRHIVDARFSERGGASTWAPGLQEEGEAFLGSLRLERMTEKEVADAPAPEVSP